MKTSEQINEIATALAAAQAEIQNPNKSTENEYFKAKYADLAEVLNVIRPAFSANGLAIIQTPFTSETGNIGVTTMIAHSSGQWMSDAIEIPAQGKNLAQEAGKAISYLRRYSAAAFCGISQEDNDSNLGAGKNDNTAPVVNLKEKPVITFEQVEALKQLITSTSTNEFQFCQFLKVDFKILTRSC